MLDARGALALNFALARDLARHVAIEARLDTADVTVDTIGARYRLRVNLPAPLPPALDRRRPRHRRQSTSSGCGRCR